MAKGVVDRLQAIDVEHDQRAARMIALDVGDRAMQLALETAPVRNIQQEVGIGGGLQLLDSGLRLGQLGLEPANRRFGVGWDAAGGRDCRLRGAGAARLFALPRPFYGVLRPESRPPWFSSSWPSLCRLAYEGLPGFTKTG